MTDYGAIIAGISAVIGGIIALITAFGLMFARISSGLRDIHILINSNLQKMLELSRAQGKLEGITEQKAEARAEFAISKQIISHATESAKTVIVTAATEAHKIVLAEALQAQPPTRLTPDPDKHLTGT